MTRTSAQPLLEINRSLSTRFLRFCHRLREMQELHMTRRALETLPDEALRDIGIHRSEIGDVARLRQVCSRS